MMISNFYLSKTSLSFFFEYLMSFIILLSGIWDPCMIITEGRVADIDFECPQYISDIPNKIGIPKPPSFTVSGYKTLSWSVIIACNNVAINLFVIKWSNGLIYSCIPEIVLR